MSDDIDLMRSKRGAASTSKSTEQARDQRRAEAAEQIRALNRRDAKSGRGR